MTKKSSKEKAKKEDEVVEEVTIEQEAQGEDAAEVNTEKEEAIEEIEEVDELTLLNQKIEEGNDKYLRLSAEYDNYRRRSLKEKMELMKTAGESMLLGLLPVVDDFDRALSHMDEASDVIAVKEGVMLIYNKFTEFLSQQGLKEIEAKELDFDTDKHEAITKIPAPTEEMKGKVIDCVEKGYILHEKVIRFSKVVVGE